VRTRAKVPAEAAQQAAKQSIFVFLPSTPFGLIFALVESAPGDGPASRSTTCDDCDSLCLGLHGGLEKLAERWPQAGYDVVGLDGPAGRAARTIASSNEAGPRWQVGSGGKNEY
jgi:hypothetical protein